MGSPGSLCWVRAKCRLPVPASSILVRLCYLQLIFLGCFLFVIFHITSQVSSLYHARGPEMIIIVTLAHALLWLSARWPAGFDHIRKQRFIYDPMQAEPDIFHQFGLTWGRLTSQIYRHSPKLYNFTGVLWQVKMWNWLRHRQSDIFVKCNHFSLRVSNFWSELAAEVERDSYQLASLAASLWCWFHWRWPKCEFEGSDELIFNSVGCDGKLMCQSPPVSFLQSCCLATAEFYISFIIRPLPPIPKPNLFILYTFKVNSKSGSELVRNERLRARWDGLSPPRDRLSPQASFFNFWFWGGVPGSCTDDATLERLLLLCGTQSDCLPRRKGTVSGRFASILRLPRQASTVTSAAAVPSFLDASDNQSLLPCLHACLIVPHVLLTVSARCNQQE